MNGLLIHSSASGAWVQIYGPELDKRCRANLKRTKCVRLTPVPSAVLPLRRSRLPAGRMLLGLPTLLSGIVSPQPKERFRSELNASASLRYRRGNLARRELRVGCGSLELGRVGPGTSRENHIAGIYAPGTAFYKGFFTRRSDRRIKALITGLTGMSLDGHCIGSFTLRLSKFC